MESLGPLHPIAEQILELYLKKEDNYDYKVFSDMMTKNNLSPPQIHRLGLWRSRSADLVRSKT